MVLLQLLKFLNMICCGCLPRFLVTYLYRRLNVKFVELPLEYRARKSCEKCDCCGGRWGTFYKGNNGQWIAEWIVCDDCDGRGFVISCGDLMYEYTKRN